MCKTILSLCVLFLTACPLYSSSPNDLAKQPTCVISEEAPCSFVNDTVNVVGGNFSLQMRHLSVPGHVPLDLVQYYNNQSNYTSWFGHGMSLNYSFWMQGKDDADKSNDKYDKYVALIAESSGGSIFKCIAERVSDTSKRKTNYYYIDPAVIYDSFTNCGAGHISARTNIKNIRLKEKENDDDYEWTSYMPDGTVRNYNRVEKEEVEDEEETTVNVKKEIRPNKTSLHYEYHKRTSELSPIKRIEAKAKSRMNWLEFERNHADCKATVTASNGKSVTFQAFKKDGNYYIEKIDSADNPIQKFEYTNAGKYYCIARVLRPEGRFLEMLYDDRGRVTSQKAPVGKDDEKRTIWNFDYHSDYTDVRDANDNKQVYHHKHGRITSIEDYKHDKLYRAKTYYWGKKEGLSWGKLPKSKEGNLLAYATLNHEKCGMSLCYYDYDDYGNILKETQCGNFTGRYPWAFWIDDDGKPKDQNIEKYHKYCSYSKDLHLLTHQSEDAGPNIEYRYIKGTDLMWAKLVRDGDKIIQREFYEYDKNGILTQKIIDDGNTANKSHLAGVTQRHITDIEPVRQKEGYGQGLPQEVWENYIDLATHKKILLKHTRFNYNKAGQVTKEAVFDANNCYRYSTRYEYDSKSRLRKMTNPDGLTVIYGYDDNNNKTFEKLEQADFHTMYEYDKADRLTATIEYHGNKGDANRTVVRSSIEYDFMGNKTASIDRYGNRTLYEYDHCNRLTKITLPSTLDGQVYTTKKEYDIFDNVIKETNQHDVDTKFEYTIRKTPSRIHYADGTEERYVYNLNGLLAHKWDKSGTKTSYKYDVLGRVTETSLYDSADNKLSNTTNTYSTFHLLSTTDPMGYTTSYTYDGAGRKIQELKESENNFSKTTFEYDSLGRLVTTKSFYGKGNYLTSLIEYDNLNRVTLEKQVDMAGECISWTYYEYNAQGMCTLQRSGHADEDAEIKNRYNSQRELVEHLDEYGNTTHTRIDHNFINSSNRKVFRKITTDPLQNITKEYYDTLGRLVSIVKKTPQDTLLAVTDYYYNGTNQKTKQIERVIINGTIDHDYTITWEYDALDRITKLIEEQGAAEEKVTSYTYDASGRIITHTKPDGTVLTHTYDDLGRLVHLCSSNGTINYTYTYDLNNNPLEVQDETSNHTYTYSYDAWNRTLVDGIKNKFTQSFAYDSIGRLTGITAPDNSSVAYTYQESRLRTISWRGLEHSYNTFDKKGRPVGSTPIGQVGVHSLTWDKKGRTTKIASPYFSQEIPQDGFDAVGNLKKCFFTDAVGQVGVTASYDSLYQLTEESGVQTHTYTNDSISNRRTKNASKYTLDGTNKLLRTAEDEFVYDKNGNLIEQRSPSKTIHFTYDALNRLIKVNDGTQQTSYLYDNFHRRIARYTNGVAHQYFLHLGQREIGLWDPAKEELKEYRVLGLGKGAELGASIAIELNGKIYCPLHDHRGNIISLVDIQSGEVAECYRYTAFGECEIYNHKQQWISKSALNNIWGFASKRLDPETGFMYFSRRYYAPTTGRWITPDPLGFADGPNMYAYVHGNPMTRYDLYGLYVEEGYNPRNWRPYECKNPQVSAAYDRVLEATYRDLGYQMRGSPFRKNQKNYNAISLANRPKYPGRNQIYVPGMGTSFVSAIKQAMYLSDLNGGYNVDIIQNFTYTLAVDIPRAGLEKFCGMNSEAVKDLRSYLGGSYAKYGSLHKNFITGFSEGAIIVNNALKSFDKDITDNCHAVTVCPGKLIPQTSAGKTINIVNKSPLRDPVPHLDKLFGGIGYAHRNESGCNVLYVESHHGANFFDHDMTSPTYRKDLKNEFTKFEEFAGQL